MSDYLYKQALEKLDNFGFEGSSGDIEEFVETLQERIALLEAAIRTAVRTYMDNPYYIAEVMQNLSAVLQEQGE